MSKAKDMTGLIGLSNHMTISDPSNNGKGSYTVLVNPSSYNVRYGADYTNDQVIASTESNYRFNRAKKQEMALDLLFDSTGSLGNIPSILGKSVLDQIEEFMAIAFVEKTEETKKTQKKPLELIWGKMHFKGVLTSVNITYSHFDTTGNPIRANAACTFSGGEIQFEKSNNTFSNTEKPAKVIDYAAAKHAINEAMLHASYISIIAEQAKATLPKSLRIKEEVAKMIIK